MSKTTERMLRKSFTDAIERLDELYDGYPFDQELPYATWLAQTYYLVTHTTRLLGVAASLFPPDQDALHRACLKGLREENGHDLLAKKDLEVLGYELAQLPELPSTVATYAHQYYRAHHCGPASLWGYSLMVEGLASLKGKKHHARMEAAHGKRAVNFMRVHARVDHGHFEAGLKEIQHLDRKTLVSILDNLEHSTAIFGQMLLGMQAHCDALGRRPRKSAA
jgi:hypothetical protein